MNKALYTNMTGMRLLGSIKFQKCHVLLAQCFIVYKGLPHTFYNLILRETMGGELGIYHLPHFTDEGSLGELTFLLDCCVPGTCHKEAHLGLTMTLRNRYHYLPQRSGSLGLRS